MSKTNLEDMYQRLAAIVDEMDDLSDAGLDEESRAMFDALETEANTLRADIERAEKLKEEKRFLNKPAKPRAPLTDGDTITVGEAPEDRKFESLGDCMRAIIRAGVPNGDTDPRLVGMNMRATGLGEAVPSAGGFLLEEQYVAGIIQRAYDSSEVLSRVRTIPVGPNSNSITLHAVDETSRANGSRLGGVQAYWRAEAGTVTASKPKFRDMRLELNSLMAICYLTDELLEDVGALDAFVPQAFSGEIRFKLEDAIINGSGAGQPLGIANSDALVTPNKESGQTAATIVPQNVAKMFSRMWARSRQNSVWFINQDCEPQLWTMTIDAGTAGTPVYLPPGGFSASPYGSLFGRPVVPVEFCQTLGTTGDIQLLDLSEYVLAVKGGARSAWSMHVQFLYAEQVFRIMMRVDGQPVWNSALTPYKGSNTQSPYIWLQTRS